jgi:hypothetical protein
MPKDKKPFVDFRDIRSRITMEQVLSHYQLLDTFKRNGKNLSGPCPIHKGTNKTQFRVDTEKNLWNCFSECKHGGNTLNFIVHMEDCSIHDAAVKACAPTRRTRSPNWGATLRFYDISLRYAPTPQAKGKIEREHQFWQGRLPPSFASEKITELAEANQHFDALRHHHNATEIHRELRQTPQRAWTRPRKKNALLCGPSARALGGPMSGTYAPASKSAAMPTSPSVPSAFVLNDRRAPRSSSASIPQATIPSWPPARTPSATHPSVHRPPQINLSCFANYKKVLF